MGEEGSSPCPMGAPLDRPRDAGEPSCPGNQMGEATVWTDRWESLYQHTWPRAQRPGSSAAAFPSPRPLIHRDSVQARLLSQSWPGPVALWGL